MTVLVTGASGHVGANLVRAILDQGRKVRALVHTSQVALEGLPVEIVKVDILNNEHLRALFQDVASVFLLAAQISVVGDPTGMVHRVNVEGTRNIVDACLEHNIKKLVHFSSIHALSQAPHTQLLDESRAMVDGKEKCLAYDLSKALAEKEVQRAVAQGLNAPIISPTAIIGPHD